MLYRTNIKNIGDPFILNVANSYFMYATTFDVVGFKVFKSNDLINWHDLGICLDLSNSSWAYKDFWAPEVVFHNGKYIMHFSSRYNKTKTLRIGVAISDKPEGPFKDVYDHPMFDLGYATIDGHVFIDDDNKKYFYYSKDCSENYIDDINKLSQIYAVEMNDDLLSIKNNHRLVLSPEKDYECYSYKNAKWNEAPFMLKKDNIYYLTYSANFFASEHYCICLAKSYSPFGPFIKNNEPLLKSKDRSLDFLGPGHNAFFYDKNSNLMMSFHIQTDSNKPSFNRKACVCDAKIIDETIKLNL